MHMKPSEHLAFRVFSVVEPESVLRFIEDQSKSVHDFWIESADGSLGALEVTSYHDVVMTRAHQAIQSTRHGGAVAISRHVRNGWWVHPSARADIRAVRSRVDSYLAQIESEGRNRFFSAVDASESPAVRAIYADLHVEYGCIFAWSTPRQIRIALPGKGTVVSSRHVLEMIQAVSHLPDNRFKLNASSCSRRVLFIEVDVNAYDQWSPLVNEPPPSVPPELPAEVSEVWVASSIGSFLVIWRWMGGVWSKHIGDLDQQKTSVGAG